MDVPRANIARRRRLIRSLMAVVFIAAAGAITVGLSRLEPAAPSVDRAGLWIDSVKRGPMLREVRGTGRLVPEIVWWIPAATRGRVQRVLVLPGAQVKSDTVLLELSNEELQLEAVNAEWTYKSAEAQLTALGVTLDNELLALQASLARVEADYQEAQLRAQIDEALFADGLISNLNVKLSRERVKELAKLRGIEQSRRESWDASREARLDVQRALVEQAKALWELKRALVSALKVRAGVDGVLEQMQVEVGEQVAADTLLAKVTNPKALKAVVRIPETQARDVLPQQRASIDTRNGIVEGRVVRIDPAVVEGTVAVDVALDGPLPKGARPDLTVVGTIEIERLDNVLYVGRPVHAQSNSVMGVFKVVDGDYAVRTSVEVGRTSVDMIEIVRGLEEGDEIILSDMSRSDEHDRVRLR